MIFRSGWAAGRRPITVSHAGRKAAFERIFLMPLRVIQTMNTEYAVIDVTIVRAYQHDAEALKKRIAIKSSSPSKALKPTALPKASLRTFERVILPKSNRKTKRNCHFTLYAERNPVELFINAMTHCRGITTRYETATRNFRAGIYRVRACAWHELRHGPTTSNIENTSYVIEPLMARTVGCAPGFK